MHFLSKTMGRLHRKGSHSKKFSVKDYKIEKQFYYKHVPKYASVRYLEIFSFDKHL